MRGREPYDLILGTSEHGRHVDGLVGAGGGGLPPFRRCIVVFGGPRGLEPVAASLGGAEGAPRTAAGYFDFYLNTCAGQGSRTIRTEEAVLISLARLVGPLRDANARRRR